MHRRYGNPLLDPDTRIWAGVLLACCAAVVAVLGVIFAHQTTADRFDNAIDSPIITWLDRHPGLAAWFAFPGSQRPAVALTVVVVVACLLTRRLNGAVLAAAAVPAAVAVNDGLCKPLFHRTYLGVLSYPSGHTATMSALAATLVVLLYVRPPSVRPGCCGSWPGLRPARQESWWPSVSSACGGTTSPTRSPGRPWVSERSALSRSSWTCQPGSAAHPQPMSRPALRALGPRLAMLGLSCEPHLSTRSRAS